MQLRTHLVNLWLRMVMQHKNMEIFWSSPLAIEIKGLDILGVRGRDQAIEEKLVNGITTISLRARYYSILTWAVGSFLKAGLEENGVGKYSDSAFRVFLRRVEFITLACTAIDDSDGNQLNGVLGRDLFAEQIRTLRAEGSVEFPQNARTAMFLTYYGPCRAAGLLKDAPGSVIPGQLTLRGRELMNLREATIPSQIKNLLLGNEPLTTHSLRLAKGSFSLHPLSIPAEERALLLKALRRPRSPKQEDDHNKFVESVEWIIAELKEKPASAEWLLVRNYAARVSNGASNGVADSWAEYEWQRRCHFAFEWLLASFCDRLNRNGDSSLSEIVSSLMGDFSKGDGAQQLSTAAQEINLQTPASVLTALVPDNYQLSAPLPTRTMAAHRGGVGAISAIQLLVALHRQSLGLRTSKVFRDTDAIANRAMQIIEEAENKSLAELLASLLLQCAIVPHLTTTLRKMGSGQRCSLRFFPDGELFRSTAVQVSAGRSGTRLANVLGILSDLSVLDLTGDAYLPGKVPFDEA